MKNYPLSNKKWFFLRKKWNFFRNEKWNKTNFIDWTQFMNIWCPLRIFVIHCLVLSPGNGWCVSVIIRFQLEKTYVPTIEHQNIHSIINFYTSLFCPRFWEGMPFYLKLFNFSFFHYEPCKLHTHYYLLFSLQLESLDRRLHDSGPS